MPRNKYVEDIRKIVGIDINQKALGAAGRKSNLTGTKGIGYKTGGAGGTTANSGFSSGSENSVPQGPNAQNPDPFDWTNFLDYGSGTNSPGNQSLDPNNPYNPGNSDSLGNSANSTHPNQASYDYNQGTYDAKDLIDGVFGPKLDGQGTLNGITGLVDRNNGKALELRLDGLVRPPPGWDDVITPPESEAYKRWARDTRWEAPGTPNGTIFTTTAVEAAHEILDMLPSGYAIDSYQEDDHFPHSGGNIRWIFTYKKTGSVDLQYYSQDVTCSAGVDSACPLTTPIKHPEDSTFQLYRDRSGTFKANPYEPDADIDTEFTDNIHAQIDFSFDSGRNGSLRPTSTGGFMVGETSGADYLGVVRVYSSSNKLVAYTTPTGSNNYAV